MYNAASEMPSTDSARSSTHLVFALGALRARQWAHFALLPFAALDRSTIATRDGVTRALLGSVAAAGALGHAYALNAIADRASDASIAKNPLAGARETPTAVWVAIAGSAMTAVLCAGFLGGHAIVLIGASLVFGTAYSVGPRLKALPVLGLVANTMIFVPLMAVAAEADRWPAAMPILAATFVGLLIQSQLLHESADAAEDAVAGARTTARLLGPRRTVAVVVTVGAVFAAAVAAAAPSRMMSLAAAAALACGALVAVLERVPARARRLHRQFTGLAGALVFVAGLSL